MRKDAHHATLAENLAGIAREGLVPNDGSRGVWPDEYDVVGKLFVCGDLEGAEHYAQVLADGTGEEARVLRFPMPENRMRDEMTDFDGAWHTTQSIAPDVIEMLDDGVWKPLMESMR